MVKIHGLLELLKNLIRSIADNTVKIIKASLSKIQTCMQNAHEKIEFL